MVQEIANSYILGIIDYVDNVESKSLSIYAEEGFHDDLFGEEGRPFKLWRWSASTGIMISPFSSYLNEEDIFRIEQHLIKNYKLTEAEVYGRY